MNTAPSLLQVAPGSLIHSPQVRTNVGQDSAFASLVESVRTLGVMQPILARRVGRELHVVAGHRRTLAAIAAELPTVPVYVSRTPDDEVTARQLVENIHRTDLNLKDTAAGVRALYDEHGSARLVAEMLGKSAPWVSKMLALTMEATAPVTQKLVAEDKLPDLECAYLLATIERRVSGKMIGQVTVIADIVKWLLQASSPREYLRGKIKALDAETSDDPAPSPAAPTITKATTASLMFSMTAPERVVMLAALMAYAPATGELPTLHALQATLRSLQPKTEAS